jgi:hypothetical protein
VRGRLASKSERPKAEDIPEPPEPQWSTLAIDPTGVEVDGQRFELSVPKDFELELKPAKDIEARQAWMVTAAKALAFE